jgi:hypothetical protein
MAAFMLHFVTFPREQHCKDSSYHNTENLSVQF